MSCRNIVSKFVDFTEGILSCEDIYEVNEHLRRCKQCQEKYNQFKILGEELEREVKIIPEPDWDQIYKRAEYSSRIVSYKFRFRPALVVAVLVLVFGAGAMFNHFLLREVSSYKFTGSPEEHINTELIGNLEECRVVFFLKWLI